MINKKLVAVFSPRSRKLLLLLLVLTALNGLFMFLEVLASQILIEAAAQGKLAARVIALVLAIYGLSYLFFYGLGIVTARSRAAVRLDLDTSHFRSILTSPRPELSTVASDELSGSVYTGRNERFIALGVVKFSDFILDTVFLVAGMAYLVAVNWIAAAICVSAYLILGVGIRVVSSLNRVNIEAEPGLFGDYCAFVDSIEQSKFQAISLGHLEILESKAAILRSRFVDCRYRISRNSELFNVIQGLIGNLRDLILLAVLVIVGQDHAAIFVVVYLAGMINDSVRGWASQAQEVMSVSPLVAKLKEEASDRVLDEPDTSLAGAERSSLRFSVESRKSERVPAGRFELKSGGWYVFEGPNGSGKSSLLRGALGLEEFPVMVSGTVDGQDFDEVPRGVALAISEQGELLAGSIEDNITMLDPNADGERLQKVLSRIGLDRAPEHSVDQLSGGERQRVLLGRALYLDPPLLVLDEAFSQVDETSVRDMARFIRHSRAGITVVVEHRRDAVLLDGSECIKIVDGKLYVKEADCSSVE